MTLLPGGRLMRQPSNSIHPPASSARISIDRSLRDRTPPAAVLQVLPAFKCSNSWPVAELAGSSKAALIFSTVFESGETSNEAFLSS